MPWTNQKISGDGNLFLYSSQWDSEIQSVLLRKNSAKRGQMRSLRQYPAPITCMSVSSSYLVAGRKICGFFFFSFFITISLLTDSRFPFRCFKWKCSIVELCQGRRCRGTFFFHRKFFLFFLIKREENFF